MHTLKRKMHSIPKYFSTFEVQYILFVLRRFTKNEKQTTTVWANETSRTKNCHFSVYTLELHVRLAILHIHFLFFFSCNLKKKMILMIIIFLRSKSVTHLRCTYMYRKAIVREYQEKASRRIHRRVIYRVSVEAAGTNSTLMTGKQPRQCELDGSAPQSVAYISL